MSSLLEILRHSLPEHEHDRFVLSLCVQVRLVELELVLQICDRLQVSLA